MPILTAAVSAHSRVEEIQRDFAAKNDILNTCGEWLSPWDFYDILFRGMDEDEKIMLIEADKRYVAMPLADAIDYGLGRSDIYISPATYFQNCYKSGFLNKIYAIAVDIDGVTPMFLKMIVVNMQRGDFPVPTAITNSGGGVHFYYVFNTPLVAYRNIREAAKVLYDELHSSFGIGLKLTQKHWIGQPYRVVGGSTKAGDISTAFKTGERWTPESLATACGTTWKVKPPIDKNNGATEKMRLFALFLAQARGIAVPDFKDFGATYDFISNNRVFINARLQNQKEETDPPRMGAKSKWYEDTRRRVLEETREGYRYSSLMALSVIAYKSGVLRDYLERDIEMISELWAREPKWKKVPFNQKNVSAALRCYSSSFLRVTAKTLEEWLGWEFPRETKRNGRTQKEHLEKIAIEKKNRSLFQVEKYLRADPDAAKKKIARETGLSLNTVKKYYDLAKSIINL